VREAVDGREALEVFARHQRHIDLVICDVAMPRLGGVELLGEIRTLAPETPVLLVTGYDPGNIAAGLAQHQHAAIMKKPFTVDVLARHINALCD